MSKSIMLSQSQDYYGLKVLGFILILTTFLAYASFYLFQNYTSNTFVMGGNHEKKVYILQSYTLSSMYEHNGMDYEEYEKRIKYLTSICNTQGFIVENIQSDMLTSINVHKSIVLAMDMMSLSQKEIDNVTQYVQKGGRLIFNFTAGFLDANLQYQKRNLVTQITPLRLNSKTNAVSFDSNEPGYLSMRLLSPFVVNIKEGRAYNLSVYDPLPIFQTPPQMKPDAYLTNWSQINYIKLATRELSAQESGLIWHGNKGKGKWVYFSFPSYVFLDANKHVFSKIFKSMLKYLDNDISIMPYPYVDANNVIFISEDTEYKYENLQKFSDVSLKNKFPVTAFCVAQLAQKHPHIMKRVAQNRYLEFGSHSLTHKKILGQSDDVYSSETIGSKQLLVKLTDRFVTGFRPPREEIDEKMLEYLEDAGFKYILSKEDNRLSPFFKKDTLLIPRHGTDDYLYLVNLDWNSTQIINEMKHQSKVLQRLNGIYTMSTHTHLMMYKSNVKIVDEFMQFVKAHKDMYPMNGHMIYERVKAMYNFRYYYKKTAKKIILTLLNNGTKPMQSLTLEVEVDSGMHLTKVESEIIGFQTKLQKISAHKYRLDVKKLNPKSQAVLFINYEKN